MKRSILALILASALVAPSPVSAQTAMDQSCAAFSAMDGDGMMKTSMQLNEEMKQKAAADGRLAPELTDEQVMKAAVEACAAKPDGSVGEAVQAAMQ